MLRSFQVSLQLSDINGCRWIFHVTCNNSDVLYWSNMKSDFLLSICPINPLVFRIEDLCPVYLVPPGDFDGILVKIRLVSSYPPRRAGEIETNQIEKIYSIQ